MLALLTFLTVVQTTVQIGGPSSGDSVRVRRDRAKRDSLAVREDSIQRKRDSVATARRKARVIPLTPALLASAFRDPAARSLLERARTARLSQDSALRAYDATTYERMSFGLKVGAVGRERLAFRAERSARIQWERGVGAVVDVTGRRAAVPIAQGARTEMDDGDVGNPVPIPYVPGRETMWVGSELAKANVGEEAILNPLTHGAEAYYTYASGDSLAFQLPGRRVLVRELTVRPRNSAWNTVVGSLWFDVESGQLVRAIYRLATPMDFVQVAKDDSDEDVKKEVPWMLRPMLFPMTGQLTVVTVDYGLFEGRFWLPRLQTMDGDVRFGAMRVPLTLQQRFDYAEVNGDIKLPPFAVGSVDSVLTVEGLRARRAERDQLCKDSSASWTRVRQQFDKTLAVLMRVPCDTARLIHSPTLPPSIFSSTDTLFASSDRDDLINRTLGLSNQGGAVAGSARRTVASELRYNRVEGANLNAHLSAPLGNGYESESRIGIATASGHVTGGLTLARSNGRQRVALTGYHRLSADNDWDDPLTYRSSLATVLFGTDPGQYYYSSGAELTFTQPNGWVQEWRLFGERDGRAEVNSTFSLARAIRGKDDVRVRPNIIANPATEFGLALRRRGSFGEDPEGFRATSDVRVEGATGTFDYVRAMADLTLSRPVGPLNAALTGSGGTSGGTLPVQKLWYLGGVRTLAGQPAGSQTGNAYWFSRLELGTRTSVLRPILFGDLGWAGDRTKISDGRPAGSAGVGLSVLDGLVRLDLARGIRPSHGTRGYLYLDARF